MELTREVLEDMAACRGGDCPDCRGVCKCDTMGSGIETLAKALLAEMDKPGVWDGAPDWATVAHIGWYKTNEQVSTSSCERYTRKPPKPRIDEIVEEAVDKYQRGAVGAGSLKDIIKSAILKDRAERKANR